MLINLEAVTPGANRVLLDALLLVTVLAGAAAAFGSLMLLGMRSGTEGR
ncbi:MAG: hypothetical protein HYY13_09105 [Nitrospirae bacterium]|nr:hypothetical protein [Nitrospirota bacterium]